MTKILDHIAKSFHSAFQPSSPDGYFALRLATRLGEPGAAAHYAVLASQYPQEKLVHAFRQTIHCPIPGASPSRLFHDYLARTNGSDSLPRPRLIALRAERRTLAAAVFSGTHLEGSRVLHLSSNPQRAEASASYFARSMMSEVDCKFAAIEQAPAKTDILRAILHRAIVAQIRIASLSLWEISKETLLAAMSHPPLKTRQQLRDLALSIWSLPKVKPAQICSLDAMALGLFVQTERFFNNF